MRSCNSYQEIKTPEDEEYEDRVNACFKELCDRYADDIEEQGMNWMQKASLEEHEELLKLPNWDNEVFKEITGIDAEAEIAKE